jgi:hypothetical protein
MLGKLFRRPQITDPALRRIYAKEKAIQEGKIRTASHVAEVEKIKARARADAVRACTPKGIQAIRTASSIGTSLGNALKKMDTDKFEAYVTGVSPDRKKKPQ